MKLETSLEITIRFSETDAMGVVWHGNYLKFFEDAREEFGLKFGLEYLDIHKEGYFTPIVQSEINHKAPVYYGQKIRVDIKLIRSSAAKLNFRYQVINLDTQEIAAVGATTQVFLEVKGRNLELNKPKFLINWESSQNWEEIDN